MRAMAASARLQIFCCLILCSIFTSSMALPFISSSALQLVPRSAITNTDSGTVQVFDSSTHQAISQGPATDGGGTGYSAPAVIWVVFCFAVGIPMALAGIRGWRATAGVGIGLPVAACAWAAFINTINASGVPDLLLTAIVMAFFFLGFVLGIFEFAHVIGLLSLGISGGMAFGIRVVLLKEGLLFSGTQLFAINWVLIALFGVLGGAFIMWPKVQRGGILFGSASIGTFLVFLGIDLLVHRQSGMSRGLRKLFDGNPAHIADMLTNVYAPQLSTQILLAISIGLTPLLAYAQHRIFKEPFSRKTRPSSFIGSSITSPFRESGFMTIPKAAAKLFEARSHFSL